MAAQAQAQAASSANSLPMSLPLNTPAQLHGGAPVSIAGFTPNRPPPGIIPVSLPFCFDITVSHSFLILSAVQGLPANIQQIVQQQAAAAAVQVQVRDKISTFLSY